MQRLLAAVLFLTASAHAADSVFSFSALDTNLDYTLTQGEVARSAAVSENFERFDRDRDQRLSPLEFNNLVLALSVPPDPFPIEQSSSSSARTH